MIGHGGPGHGALSASQAPGGSPCGAGPGRVAAWRHLGSGSAGLTGAMQRGLRGASPDFKGRGPPGPAGHWHGHGPLAAAWRLCDSSLCQ
jgi:hypothetical protein